MNELEQVDQAVTVAIQVPLMLQRMAPAALYSGDFA